MSLIEEALRKIQDPWLPPEPKGASPAATSLRPAGARPATAFQPTTVALLIVAVAIFACTAVLLVAGGLWIGRTLSPPAPAQVEPVEIVQPTPLPPVQPEPPAPPPPTPQAPEDTLVISGVAEGPGPGEAYAVINGVIVAVGEPIGEFTLTAIEHGTVRLRRTDGSETIIRVPR